MREQSTRSMLRWIRAAYQMSPAALARMFQQSPRTVNAWLREGRVSARGGSKIRSAFYYLHNLPDPREPERSGIWMA